MAHIIEYTKKRFDQIKANYYTELAKAKQLQFGMSQVRGNELLESDFTDNELAELDKMVRESLGNDYDVLYVKHDHLVDDTCKQSYITYAIIHKDLFARSKSSYDKKSQSIYVSDVNNAIIIRNHAGGYLSTRGYTWFIFTKDSNSDTIMYRSNDVETFGIKPKYKKHWVQDRHTYWCSEILFDKYLETCRNGIESVKQRFEQFV